jgi:hypothetical protein
MSKSNGWRISADWGATSALLTIKHTVKHIFSYNKMGRKIPLFVKGGALKNITDTSHSISVFSHGENPTEFFCIVCLVPLYKRFAFLYFLYFLKLLEISEFYYFVLNFGNLSFDFYTEGIS